MLDLVKDKPAKSVPPGREGHNMVAGTFAGVKRQLGLDFDGVKQPVSHRSDRDGRNPKDERREVRELKSELTKLTQT